MEARILLPIVIASVIIFSLFISYLIYLHKTASAETIEEKVKNFDTSLVDECEDLMLKNDLTFALCGIKYGKIYLREDTNFSPGEYVGLQVNLQKLNVPFENYYSCAYINLPRYETAYPLKYGETKPEIFTKPTVFCSPLLNKKDYHHLGLSSFVLNMKGEYKVVEIYVFNGSLPENFKFEDNLDKGIKVFELKGRIS